ncbi:MAG: hypothetical protein HDR21_13690 [Lachnospiraceae bacterium]|nr:hypothetical protein [Lachnospiraceae bacterium]MBD5482095.1 hypothetical protein [Lachnospiraceae bacterium]
MFQIDPAKKTEIFQDALNELGNIGASNAATALSQMMNNILIRLSVTTVRLIGAAEACSYVRSEGHEHMVGVYLDIVGDIHGRMLFLLHRESVDSLVSAMTGGMDPAMLPDEMKASAMQEVGNIITASYINSLSTMTGLTIDESVPTVIIDTIENILATAMQNNGKILFVQSQLRAESANVQGFFVFMPDPPSFAILMKGLGM